MHLIENDDSTVQDARLIEHGAREFPHVVDLSVVADVAFVVVAAALRCSSTADN